MERERLLSTRGAGWASIGSAVGVIVLVAVFFVGAMDDALDEDGTITTLTQLWDVVVIVGLLAALALFIRGMSLLATARKDRDTDREAP